MSSIAQYKEYNKRLKQGIVDLKLQVDILQKENRTLRFQLTLFKDDKPVNKKKKGGCPRS